MTTITDADGDVWYWNHTYGKYVLGGGHEKLVLNEKQIREIYGFREKSEQAGEWWLQK